MQDVPCRLAKGRWYCTGIYLRQPWLASGGGETTVRQRNLGRCATSRWSNLPLGAQRNGKRKTATRSQVDTLRFSADMRLPVAIEDVTVSALRSGISDNGRTLSYSVKDDALAKALPTAAEVLRRVPLGSVTGEGVPMLRAVRASRC